MTIPEKIRKKRDTSKKHSIILEGAIKVFIERGFEATSMDKVAEVANVSKRTIYNHFPSKEILFKAIVADFLRHRDNIKPIQYTSSISLQEQLRKFISAELYLVDDSVRRGLSKLLTSTFLMNAEFGYEVRSEYKPYENFIEWLLVAQKDEKIDFKTPQLVAQIFYGLVEGCLTWNALFSDGENLESREAMIDEIIETFLSRYQVT